MTLIFSSHLCMPMAIYAVFTFRRIRHLCNNYIKKSKRLVNFAEAAGLSLADHQPIAGVLHQPCSQGNRQDQIFTSNNLFILHFKTMSLGFMILY